MNSNLIVKRRLSAALLPWLTLGLVLCIAAGLRLYSLPRPPAGPYYDEAANGIMAQGIAEGQSRPLFIAAYTGKEVLFFYWAAAWIRLSGAANLTTLRLSSAIAGLLTVVAAVWLVYELFAPADDEQQAVRQDFAQPPAPRCGAGDPERSERTRQAAHDPSQHTRAIWLALFTAALLATSFWHLVLSRVGLRAVTQPLLQSLALAALWRGLRTMRLRWTALGGAFCGLTAYTYLAARLFPIPLALALLALLLLDRSQRRRRLKQAAVFALSAAVVFAPLGLYFLQHPDQFFVRIDQIGQSQGQGLTPLQAFFRALEMFFLRGDPSPRYNLVERPVFGPLAGSLFVLGLLIALYRLFRSAAPLVRARQVLLLVWVPLMILPTALTVADEIPSNLRAAGLIPLVFLYPAWGAYTLFAWLRPRLSFVSTNWGLTGVCLLLLAITLPRDARAYFDQLAHSPQHYDLSEGDLVAVAEALNRADLQNTTPYVASLHYRHPTLAFLSTAYPRVKWLAEGQTLVYPPQGEALTFFPRSVLRDLEWLDEKLPAAALLEVGQGPGQAPAYLVYRFCAPAPAPATLIEANLGNVVEVVGYDLRQDPQADEKIDLLLTWRVQALSAQSDMLAVLRLADPWGHWWGEVSHFRYPSEQWTPGETVIDHYRLPLAPGAPPGDYDIQVSFYSASSDSSLPLLDAKGSYAGTVVALPLRLSRAQRAPDPAELDIYQQSQQKLNQSLTLLGYNLYTRQARPGEKVRLTLFWRTEAAPGTDWSVQLSVGEHLLYHDTPVHGSYPTDQWTAGEIVTDHYDPRLPLTLEPGDYSFYLSLVAADGSTAGAPLQLGALRVLASERSFETPAMQYPQQANFGDQIELLGYDLDASQSQPGGVVRLTLHWRALDEMETDYAVFTHLLDANGQVAAQKDNPPLNGSLPTSLWLAGQVISDPFVIELPDDLPPGEYPLEIGFYLVEGGARLGDAVVLGTSVQITP